MLAARRWLALAPLLVGPGPVAGLVRVHQDLEALEAEDQVDWAPVSDAETDAATDAPDEQLDPFKWDDHLNESRFLYPDGGSPVLSVFSASLSSQPNTTDSHVARRRALALRIKQNQASDEDIEAYAREYWDEFQKRQLIYLLHVSKSAGTFFCSCAQRDQHCLTPVAPVNCFVDGVGTMSDGPRWGTNDFDFMFGRHPRPKDLRTCSSASLSYKLKHLDFVCNENTLLDDGVCRDQFWNLVVVRNPVNRLISHLAHLYSMGHQEFHAYKLRVAQLPWLAPKLSDNYYIRSLMGHEVFNSPFGSINKQHLEEAKARLEQFDLVYVRDETQENLAMITQRELGMSCPNEISLIDQASGHTDEYNAQLEQNWQDADWSLLREQNRPDMELFQHAQRLRKLDRLVFKHRVFKGMLKTLIKKRRDGHPCGYMADHSR